MYDVVWMTVKFHSASPREILLSSKLHHKCDLSQISHQNMLLHVNHMVTLHCCHLCRTVPES